MRKPTHRLLESEKQALSLRRGTTKQSRDTGVSLKLEGKVGAGREDSKVEVE